MKKYYGIYRGIYDCIREYQKSGRYYGAIKKIADIDENVRLSPKYMADIMAQMLKSYSAHIREQINVPLGLLGKAHSALDKELMRKIQYGTIVGSLKSLRREIHGLQDSLDGRSLEAIIA